ncbi:MAG: glycosyltransferase [Kiritimatiellae bacterium]|nr:glycosyltransferase [Kiritimatiellia bacterium]
MNSVLSVVILVLYLIPTLGLVAYGLNCYVMLVLFVRRRRQAVAARRAVLERVGTLRHDDPRWPVVTTQIAVYNEVNVIERAMRAAANMIYPPDKHEIQVLDDSTDETREVVDRVAAELRSAGRDVKVVRRPNRHGFKAGALANGLRTARGDLIVVFDADFIPPADYLLSTVPFFLGDEKLGFLQVRWGHLNRNHSFLTRAQSVGIDSHFLIEQVARCWNGLFMNFNGTAGIWRKKAIEAAGGWHEDTLTEDLDLSYRTQFAGWHGLYLPDVVVPAELPCDVNAFRTQQFRWAKGSVQTLIKLMPQLLKSNAGVFKKIEAVLHIGGYIVHPMMLALALLSLPSLAVASAVRASGLIFAVLSVPICLSVVGPTCLCVASQKVAYRDWWRRVALMPLVLVVGVGLALSNSRAVVEALLGRKTEFVRTPKLGDRPVKRYRVRFSWVAVLEVFLGLYSGWAMTRYGLAGKFVVIPFLAIYAAGFLYMGLMTLFEASRFGDGLWARPMLAGRSVERGEARRKPW